MRDFQNFIDHQKRLSLDYFRGDDGELLPEVAAKMADEGQSAPACYLRYAVLIPDFKLFEGETNRIHQRYREWLAENCRSVWMSWYTDTVAQPFNASLHYLFADEVDAVTFALYIDR